MFVHIRASLIIHLLAEGLIISLRAMGQSSTPLVTIYSKETAIAYIEYHQNEYLFYRAQDGSCLGRWDGTHVYIAHSQIPKGMLKEGRLFDAQKHLLYLVEETPDKGLLLKHPLTGPCWKLQDPLPILPSTHYHWQWHNATPSYKLLYPILIYFVYFIPSPLC